MTRETALTLISVAGYHEDKRSFVRLYCENRITWSKAQAAYARGRRARLNGTPCDCGECKKEASHA